MSVEDHDRLTTWMVDIAAEDRSTTIDATPTGYRIGTNGSFEIKASGFWCDYEAGGAAKGHGVLSLLRYKHQCDPATAIQHGLDFLATHLGEGRFRLDGTESETDAADESLRQGVIDVMWAESAAGRGVPHLESYFRTERLITTITDEDWHAIRWIEDARGNEGSMLVPIRDADGSLVAVQQTFITPEGSKSPHKPQRMTLRGPRDWSRRGLLRLGDPTARRIYLCEGVEDGLAVRMARAELVGVTLGVGNLGLAKLPASVKEVVVVRDPEPLGAPGDKALWAGVVRLLGQGRRILVTPRAPVIFKPTAANTMKDANDVLRAHGADGVQKLLDAAKPATEWSEEISHEAVFDAVAHLSTGAYEHARTPVAKMLDWRVTALDRERNKRIKEYLKESESETAQVDPTDRRRIALPHPEPQALDQILDDIKAHILRHIHVDEWVADLLAVFAAYSHVYQLFDFAVRVRFHSVDPESGKTTLMMLVLQCCQCWRRSDDITAAALSRAFHKPGGCTLGLDEDTSMDGRDLVVAIIRAGFDREGQRDLMDKDEDGAQAEVSFNLFGPVMMTGLKPLEPMLQTRCVAIAMQPPLPPDIAGGEKKKPKVRKRAKKLCADYASRLARWAADVQAELQALITEVEEAGENETDNDLIPTWVDNRTEDKLAPLFIVAYAAGPAWHARMVAAARRLSPMKTREELPLSVRLLLDIRDLFARDQKRAWATGELREALVEGEDKTHDTVWADIPLQDGRSSGKALSPTQLGGMLQRYGIRRRRPWDHNPTAPRPPRRYQPEDFKPVFDRYLTPGRIGTPEDLDGERRREDPPEPPREPPPRRPRNNGKATADRHEERL